MRWPFGKKKNIPATTNVNNSIDKLGNTSQLLQKRERLLQQKIEEESLKAQIAMKQGNRTAAKLSIQRKKKYEQQIQRMQNQMANLDTMQMQLDSANIDAEILNTQKDAAGALKGIYQKTGGIDKIHDTMDDIKDTLDDVQELSDALSQPLGGDLLDDDDLEAELAAMEDEDALRNIGAMQPIPKNKLPKSSEKAVEKNTVDDAELAALEAEMAGM